MTDTRISLESPPDVGAPGLRFVDAAFDVSDRDALEKTCADLLERSIDSEAALVRFLEDWSEVASLVDGETARRYIAMTCDTKSDETKERYVSFERDIVAVFRVLEDKINRKYLESPCREGLPKRYSVFDRVKSRAAEIFRAANTPLFVRDRELSTQWDELQGAVTIEFRGETRTPQQCAAFLEEPDRATREEAFRAICDRRIQDRDSIDEIFAQQIAVRDEVARNAGFENYRDFRFADLARFDYTPEDCAGFHDAVESEVLPAVRELGDLRREALGVDTLRPWDFAVHLTKRDALKAFTTAEEYTKLTRTLFREVDPVFEGEFDVLERNGLLDLMSRKGKAPGGYNYPIEDVRVPFIFFNAVGTHSDVQTLLHEGGHAFHTLATRDEPLRDYREAPIEFCEVASMAMELFGLERIGAVYDEADARESTRTQLMSIVQDFCWFATIDAYQHWLYTHVGHSREERTAAWLEIYRRFAPTTDWSGLEPFEEALWQRQGHLFSQPFYYIEYAIAQIGALQAWLFERRDHAGAVEAYRAALALGGSRPLPELFETAGLEFGMDRSILGRLIPALMERIRELS